MRQSSLLLLLAALPSVQPFVAGPAPALGPARPARAAQPPRCVALGAKKAKKGGPAGGFNTG